MADLVFVTVFNTHMCRKMLTKRQNLGNTTNRRANETLLEKSYKLKLNYVCQTEFHTFVCNAIVYLRFA